MIIYGKSRGRSKQDLEGTYIPGIAHLIVFLIGFFSNFQGINPHNFTKYHSDFGNEKGLVSSIIFWDMNNLFDPKSTAFQTWGLKAGFGQVGSKQFIKPLVQNPRSNFHSKPHFIQNQNLDSLES